MSANILQHISLYLGYSCDRISLKTATCSTAEGKTLQGLSTVVKYITIASGQKSLLGNSFEEQALVGQWLEFTAVVLDRCSKGDLQQLLKGLNLYLEDRVYFAGNRPTISDIVLYAALYNTFKNMTYQEKQNVLHLSRWFNQVQHLPRVRQNLDEVHFQKNLIYSKWTH